MYRGRPATVRAFLLGLAWFTNWFTRFGCKSGGRKRAGTIPAQETTSITCINRVYVRDPR